MSSDDGDVSDAELLAVFVREDADALLDREVAAELPLSVERVQDRLEALYERGDLERRTDDPRGETWRLADDVDRDELPSESRIETETEEQAQLDDEAEPHPDHAEAAPEPETRPVEPAPADPDVEDAIARFDPPGEPEQRERRRGALRAAYLYLTKRGRAEREDFVEDVFPQSPADYDVPDEGWWDEVVDPGLEEVPGVTYDADAGAWVADDEPADRP